MKNQIDPLPIPDGVFNIMTKLIFYKCRWCGVVFTVEHEDELHLKDTLLKREDYEPTVHHECSNDRCGIGDLIGARLKEDGE